VDEGDTAFDASVCEASEPIDDVHAGFVEQKIQFVR
jgi:hypothetical protein